MALPRFRAAPALFVGGAAALLFGVAAAGMFRADKPITVFSDDTEMKSVTGKLVTIAVAAPPKQEVKPAEGKLPTMPENLGDTPVFAPQTAPPPVLARAAPAPRPEIQTVEDEIVVAPEYARSPPRWRQTYDDAYVERTARWRPVTQGDQEDDRYIDQPRYEDQVQDRYAARDRRTSDRREYVERYYTPPPPYRAEPRYGQGW